MLELQPQSPSDESCPKRQWVMLSLADDDSDAVDGAGGRSHLLNAHLAHCTSCRELAERVLRVESRLDDLADRVPSPVQVQSILDRGLAAIRNVNVAPLQPEVEMSDPTMDTSWRARVVRRLLHPKPGRFGGSPRSIQLRHAMAASLLIAVIGGGYLGYRQFNLSGSSAVAPVEVREEAPWVQVPTLSEMGVSERLTEWQMKARSPFEKIQGWKGPIRRLDDADLNIEWGSESAVVSPEPTPTEENSTIDQAEEKVAARRQISSPPADLQPKTPTPVDSTAPAVLSKGFKDTR